MELLGICIVFKRGMQSDTKYIARNGVHTIHLVIFRSSQLKKNTEFYYKTDLFNNQNHGILGGGY